MIPAGIMAAALLVGWIWLPVLPAAGQLINDCLTCHEDPNLTGERDGRQISVYLDIGKYRKSMHGEMECIDCHSDLDGVEDFSHTERLEPVDCGLCHVEIAEIYNGSLHGRAVKEGGRLAPRCADCHGAHDILAVSSPDSRVTKFNIPFVCSRCHKEGTAVSETYDIPQDSILIHYSELIHGVGLFKQGLTVTAVCLVSVYERKIL